MKEARFAIDIDQTAADGIVQAHMMYYREALKLDIADDEWTNIQNGVYASTFLVPSIIAAIEQNNKDFVIARNALRNSKPVHQNLTPIKRSQEGILQLTEGNPDTHAGYYTVRPHILRDTTSEWLKSNQFPEAHKLTISGGHADKITQVVGHHIFENNRYHPDRLAVLIDDNLDKLLQAGQELYEEYRDSNIIKQALSQLAIVGFGHKQRSGVQPDTGVRFFSLPDWQKDSVDNLKEVLQNQYRLG